MIPQLFFRAGSTWYTALIANGIICPYLWWTGNHILEIILRLGKLELPRSLSVTIGVFPFDSRCIGVMIQQLFFRAGGAMIAIWIFGPDLGGLEVIS